MISLLCLYFNVNDVFTGCKVVTHLFFFLYQHTSHISQYHLFPQITYLCWVRCSQRGFLVMSREQ